MKVRLVAVFACAAALQIAGAAEDQAQKPEPLRNLYAAEIKTGPAWDNTKPAQEQAHFRDHSDNLKRLRDEGRLILGARYSDKGLVILQAASAEEARALMERDPAIQHGIFSCQIHDFNVFYPGTVERKSSPAK